MASKERYTHDELKRLMGAEEEENSWFEPQKGASTGNDLWDANLIRTGQGNPNGGFRGLGNRLMKERNSSAFSNERRVDRERFGL